MLWFSVMEFCSRTMSLELFSMSRSLLLTLLSDFIWIATSLCTETVTRSSGRIGYQASADNGWNYYAPPLYYVFNTSSLGAVSATLAVSGVSGDLDSTASVEVFVDGALVHTCYPNDLCTAVGEAVRSSTRCDTSKQAPQQFYCSKSYLCSGAILWVLLLRQIFGHG